VVAATPAQHPISIVSETKRPTRRTLALICRLTRASCVPAITTGRKWPIWHPQELTMRGFHAISVKFTQTERRFTALGQGFPALPIIAMPLLVKPERGHPLRRVSTGKKASVPNFFLIGLHTLLPRSLLHRALLEPVFSSFDFRSFLAEPLLNEATRSVTHLVLAPDRKCLFIKSFPSFLRLSCDRLSAPIPLQRDQKTFSTGPCSFSFKSFGFVVACHQAPNVQPVFDSRHGRIACKILSPTVPLLVG
jgi:hypothetical protein